MIYRVVSCFRYLIYVWQNYFAWHQNQVKAINFDLLKLKVGRKPITSKFTVQKGYLDSLFVPMLILLLWSCPGRAWLKRQAMKSNLRMDGFAEVLYYEHKLATVNSPKISLEWVIHQHFSWQKFALYGITSYYNV